jgi:hypothetical protein
MAHKLAHWLLGRETAHDPQMLTEILLTAHDLLICLGTVHGSLTCSLAWDIPGLMTAHNSKVGLGRLNMSLG